MSGINATIAIHQGWRFEPPIIPNEHNKGYWHKFDTSGKRIYGQLSPENPPDFQGDARLYMALFEEMSSEFFSLNLMQHDYNNKTTIIGDYRQGHNENIPKFVAESEPIGTAICLAYMKLHGLECEG
jgi:hypothetical protein